MPYLSRRAISKYFQFDYRYEAFKYKIASLSITYCVADIFKCLTFVTILELIYDNGGFVCNSEVILLIYQNSKTTTSNIGSDEL